MTQTQRALLAAVMACLVVLSTLTIVTVVITGDQDPHCPDGLTTTYTQTLIPYIDDSGNAREHPAVHATCTPEGHQ